MTNLGPAIAGLALGSIFAASGAFPAHADSTKPYGDSVTSHMADRLHGTHRGGWLATTLDTGYWTANGQHVNYTGPRHAEEILTTAGHGKRWIGVIHVASTRAAKVRKTLRTGGVWFAQRHGQFVLPLKSKDYTDGGAAPAFQRAARWAASRLGWSARTVVR